MVRKTPRPPEEARAIARALRKRFISAEVEATALETLRRLNIDPAAFLSPSPKPAEAAPAPKDPAKMASFWGRSSKESTIAAVREREGIVLPEADKPFTDDEKRKARAVLAVFKERYGTPEKPN
ncbi:MAG: hypothetical protein ACOVKO_09320 [Elstera sp.]